MLIKSNYNHQAENTSNSNLVIMNPCVCWYIFRTSNDCCQTVVRYTSSKFSKLWMNFFRKRTLPETIEITKWKFYISYYSSVYILAEPNHASIRFYLWMLLICKIYIQPLWKRNVITHAHAHTLIDGHFWLIALFVLICCFDHSLFCVYNCHKKKELWKQQERL